MTKLRSRCQAASGTGQVLRLPELNDLQGGGERSAAPSAPQPIASDLLPRRVVKLNKDKVGELVLGSTVLVTGAGGSIGSGFAASYEPGTEAAGPAPSSVSLYAIGSELS
jgi:FlaA1/EpsC-like NDP-sugar epimerase